MNLKSGTVFINAPMRSAVPNIRSAASSTNTGAITGAGVVECRMNVIREHSFRIARQALGGLE